MDKFRQLRAREGCSAADTGAARKAGSVAQTFSDQRDSTAALLQLSTLAQNSPMVVRQQALAQRIGKDAGVLQSKKINLGPHGEAEIPDSVTLTPDKPNYGGTQTVLGHKVASSMEVLVTPNHPVGSAPKEMNDLFDLLPTKGVYDFASNSGKKESRDGNRLYIKGHLLNDNLGGPGTTQNLFPITHQANVDHNRKVEEAIKDRVNGLGEVMRYKVLAEETKTGNSDLNTKDGREKLKYVDGKFTCTTTEYPPGKSSVSKQVVINSTWDKEPDNEDSLTLNEEYVKASALDKGKVKVMPRAKVKVKAEWDKTYDLVVQTLATESKTAPEKWLQKLKIGIGPKGSDLLLSGVTYESLGRVDKRTLSTTRNILKNYIDSYYIEYLNAEADDKDDTVDDADKDSEAAEDLKQIETDVEKVEESLSELDKIVIEYESIDDLIAREYGARLYEYLDGLNTSTSPASWRSGLESALYKIKSGVIEAKQDMDASQVNHATTLLLDNILRRWQDKRLTDEKTNCRTRALCRHALLLNDLRLAGGAMHYTIKKTTLWDNETNQSVAAGSFVSIGFHPIDQFYISRNLPPKSTVFEAEVTSGALTGWTGSISKDAVAVLPVSTF